MPRLSLSDDHMKAFLTLAAGEILAPQALRDLLASAGIIEGVFPLPGTPLVGPTMIQVAQGVPSIPGRAGHVEIVFRDDALEWERILASGGGEDWWATAPNRRVAVGTVLAYRHAPVQPRPGTTVLGRLHQPPLPEDVLMRAGEGATLDEAGATVTASVSGNPYYEDGLVTVREVREVQDNLSAQHEPIDVAGDVVIVGHVLLGGKVRAGGNVIVEGSVLGGEIEANGTIRVRGGVRNGARLDADGHVLVRSLEASFVGSKGHLVVQQDILHAETDVYGEIHVRGAIVGGNVHAGARGVTAVVGASGYVPTSVAIASPVDQSQFAPLDKEQAKVLSALKALWPRLRHAEAILAKGASTPEAAAARKIVDLARLLEHREQTLMARKRALGVRLRGQRSRLDVLVEAHPGVTLQMGSATALLEAPYPAGTFLELDGTLGFKATG